MLRVLTFGLFVTLAAMAGLMGFMVGDRAIPFVRYSGEITPSNPAPGSTVVVTWYGHRYRYCPGVVVRKITDSHGEVHNFAPVTAIYSETENPDPMPRTFRLPAHIAAGPAEYVATTAFACPYNPLHRWWPIVVDTPTIKFNVSGSPEP